VLQSRGRLTLTGTLSSGPFAKGNHVENGTVRVGGFRSVSRWRRPLLLWAAMRGGQADWTTRANQAKRFDVEALAIELRASFSINRSEKECSVVPAPAVIRGNVTGSENYPRGHERQSSRGGNENSVEVVVPQFGHVHEYPVS
jgi:hypothetical protein